MSGEACRIVKILLLLKSFKDEKQMFIVYWEEYWICLGGGNLLTAQNGDFAISERLKLQQ